MREQSPPKTGLQLNRPVVHPRRPVREPDANGSPPRPTYPKVFRYRAPDGSAPPATVEIAGTFTEWRRLPVPYDPRSHAWQLNFPEIPANKTHHYMLLVDGRPAQDTQCDGLAMPQGLQEEQYAIQTPRGPRVFMLFAQTK